MSTNTAPNIVLPLVASFNDRAISVASSAVLDQYKVNSWYQAIKNIAGETTIYLCKRPGVEDSSSSFGSGSQIPWLVSTKPGATSTSSSISQQWVFATLGNDVRASDSASNTVIVTAAGYAPVYSDLTAISGVENLVLQLRNTALAQTVWYSTAIGTFTQITDGDFTGLNIMGKMECMDGWTFALTSNDRIYNSNINSLANWTAGQFISKQIKQDQSRGLARFGQQILAFGSETMEVFRNAGKESGSPLESVSSGFQRVGIPAQSGQMSHYYCRVGHRMYFTGQEASNKDSNVPSTAGIAGVYAYDGQNVEKVSTFAIDKIINERGGIKSMFPMFITGQRAIACDTVGQAAGTGFYALMFFPDQNEWFVWTSSVFSTINGGEWFLGQASTAPNELYSFVTSNNWSDNGTNYDFIHRFKLPSKGTPRQTMHFCGVNADTKLGAALTVNFYDLDADFTTPVTKSIDLSTTSKIAHRCGRFQDRTVELKNSTDHGIRLRTFFARVD